MKFWRRLYSLYMGARGRRHWLAVSPFASLDLGFLTDEQVLDRGTKLGRVSFIDREKCVIFFDTHLVQPTTEKL